MAFARDDRQQGEYRRVFAQDEQYDQYDDQEWDEEYLDENDMTYDDYMDFLTEEERRRDQWRVLSGVADLILCRPLLLPPSIFPSIRVFFNESALHIRWP